MTAAGYTLEPVESLGSAATAAVRRIYEDGFPPRLRAGFGTLTAQRQPGELALALLRGGQPCGFAMLRRLGETGWVFLRYFVVDERLRGQGLGGIMWDALTVRLRGDGATLLVFDVEDPAEPGCGPEQARIRARRIGFYRRHGASVLPVQGYRTPHGSEWTPMLLLAAPLEAGSADTGARWAGAAPAGAIVSAVYQYRWHLDPGHPRAAAVRIIEPERASAPQRGCDVAVDYELTDSVAWIRLNRPYRLNAVVPALTAGLITALDRAGQEGARVAVLAGRGRAFCSGHDLKEPVPTESVLATRLRVASIQDVTRAIRRFPGPVLAAVHGYALGAGAEFALGCDLVVAAEDAQFGFPEVSVGLSVTGGISRLLPLLVGPVRAKELLLLGERFSSARALEWGLVNQVAPAGQHEKAAAEVAARLVEQPPLALALAKQAMDRGVDCALEEAMAAEVDFAALTVARGAAADGD